MAILEFVLRTQVVLTQYFGIRLELRWLDGLACNAVKDLGHSRNGIAVVGRDRFRFIELGWSSWFGFADPTALPAAARVSAHQHPKSLRYFEN
ncbi:MAG: hypothetical protein IH908_11815 [Proteobacteria bacterium]|nr:hypothetical protein [Pseudomonadota bacterium]